MLFGGQGNYHFVNNDQFDVYAGLRLGYVNISADQVGGSEFQTRAEASGVLLGAQIGGDIGYLSLLG